MNHEITKAQRLLNEQGNLNEPGYSKKEVFEYNRKDIKVSKLKIKEWDYYFIGNKKYGLCLSSVISRFPQERCLLPGQDLC